MGVNAAQEYCAIPVASRLIRTTQITGTTEIDEPPLFRFGFNSFPKLAFGPIQDSPESRGYEEVRAVGISPLSLWIT